MENPTPQAASSTPNSAPDFQALSLIDDLRHILDDEAAGMSEADRVIRALLDSPVVTSWEEKCSPPRSTDTAPVSPSKGKMAPQSMPAAQFTPRKKKPSRAGKTSKTFVLFPKCIAQETWDEIMSLSTNLTMHDDAFAYRRILQYILFSNYLAKEDAGKQVVPVHVIAALVGGRHNHSKFRSLDWLEAFSQDVFPLHTSGWKYVDGLARTISPEIPPEIHLALERDRQHRMNKKTRLVFFDTGTHASRRKWADALKEHEEAVIRVQAIPPNHPGKSIKEFLEDQPPHSLIKIIKKNWSKLDQAVEALPRTTEHEFLTYEYSRCLANHLKEHQKMRYTVLENSPRVYTMQMTVNQLPRELRKIALAGAFELDIRACQLAIVAKEWGISELQVGLETLQAEHSSYWSNILEYLGLDAASKGILKDITYGLLFGMGRKRMRQELADGNKENDGIGEEKAALFLQHPWIKEIFKARRRVRAQVKAAGGAFDAFGRWIEVKKSSSAAERFYWLNKTGKRRDPVASVMAQVVQSHELKLMASILPVVEKEKSIRILSWLHDGVTVAITEPSRRRDPLVKKLQEAVRIAAEAGGFATELEEKRL